jgi:uncharacterized protein YcbK (DUF882 family)
VIARRRGGLILLACFARQFASLSIARSTPRAGYQAGLASLLLLIGAGSVHDATALNETRTLSFHHTHSDEDLTVTFKRDGRYDEDALKKLNHYLRDWRTQDEIVMDRHLFDILWEVYRDVDGQKPIQIISSYRSPATNAMLRRRSSAVARFSQHMLGHAMDFYIPDVPLEQIRYAGLRLQRGGVGFYPTSGSPFVHLDTGSIRHWPRMTHDQLVRVFPNGRTVHVPSDGVPLKEYELARADIEKRGDGEAAAPASRPSLFAALFRSKANDEDDDAASAAEEKPAPVAQAPAKSADPLPMPRAKPQIAAAFQLASADAQLVQPPKSKQAAAPPADKAAPAADKTEPKPQTPADIINTRGFWGDASASPKQATPAQVAAINARRAVPADPEPTASVSSAYQAFAYAPPSSSPVDRANIVAASAPMPRGAHPSVGSRNAAPATEINTVAAKGAQGQDGQIATSARIAGAKGNDIWLRVVMLAPSVSMSMSVTRMGDTDLTMMREFFVKPQTAVAMNFSDDPMMGLSCDRFSGFATVRLQTLALRATTLR